MCLGWRLIDTFIDDSKGPDLIVVRDFLGLTRWWWWPCLWYAGGLDDLVSRIHDLCELKKIPVVYGLSRTRLTRAMFTDMQMGQEQHGPSQKPGPSTVLPGSHFVSPGSPPSKC